MAKLTPFINGDFAPIHGSFVISPGLTASLDLDGHRLHLVFVNDDSGISKAVTSETDNDRTLTIINPVGDSAAVDVRGYRIGDDELRLSLAIQTIGKVNPHRIVTYSLVADKFLPDQEVDWAS